MADGQVGKARRNHQRLLRAADDDVNAIAVHVKGGGTKSGDGVNDQQGTGSLQQAGERGDIVAHAGGCFRGLHENGLHVRREQGLNLADGERLAIGFGEDDGFTVEGLGQRNPALAEFAGAQHQNLVAGAGEIADGGFHGSGA